MKSNKAKIVTLGLLALAILFALYFTYVERNLLIAKQVSIDLNGSRNVRIVQFTDTHIGEYFSANQLEKVVTKINKQNPDIVVFTGDMFDIPREITEKELYSKILNGITAPLGKFAVYGNRDYGGGGKRDYEQVMNDAGFAVLIDEKVRIPVGNQAISLFGADDFIFGKPDIGGLVEEIDEADTNILLVHEPDAILNYTEFPIDLAISGHSHGGQVVLPFYGAIITTTYCDEFFKGLYKLENKRSTKIFVSSGIGNTKLPFRLGNIPEIAVLDLKL